MASSSWNQLPKDLFKLLLREVDSQLAIVQLRAVCRSWRSFLSPSKLKIRVTQKLITHDKYLHLYPDYRKRVFIDEHNFMLQAGLGHLENIKWMVRVALRRCSPIQICNIFADNRIMYQAAKGGHLEVMKWLRHPVVDDQILIPWSFGYHTPEGAVECGNLENMKWLASQGCSWTLNSECFKIAIKHGNLDILK